MDRAISTIREALNREGPITLEELEGLIKRIIIANNSIAQLLNDPGDGERTNELASSLLWRLGEELGILTDGARR